MPETYRIYLDQMLRLEVARALTDEGYDVLRASEVARNGRMIFKYCRQQLTRIEFLLRLIIISAIG